MDSSAPPLVYLAAKRFIHYIHHTLKDEDQSKYDEFTMLMKDYKDERIGLICLKHKVAEVFKDYPELQEEFTRFLPVNSLEYKNCVRETLKNEDKLYEEFLKLLEEFETQRIDIEEVRGRLCQLFKDHRQLLEEFHSFVTVNAVAYGHTVKEYFQDRNHMRKYNEFLRLLRQYQTGGTNITDIRDGVMELFKNHRLLIRGFNKFLPERLCIPSFEEVRVGVADADARGGECQRGEGDLAGQDEEVGNEHELANRLQEVGHEDQELGNGVERLGYEELSFGASESDET